MTLSAWVISTYQPQPRIDGEPSRSQPHHAPEVVNAWHRTSVTMPPAAARIGVPRAAMRSTPSWVGRDGVRNPDPIAAVTGATQPDAAIWPGCAQVRLPGELTVLTNAAERAAPFVSALTICVA